MREQQETLTDAGTSHDYDFRASDWVLSVVHHPRARCVGQRRVMLEGMRMEIGRNGRQLDEGALEDAKLSRRHLELSRRDGVIVLRDLESRNGTYVNGERATHATLADGDVIGIGQMLLLIHRGPRIAARCDHASIIASSAAMATVLDRIALAAQRDVTVLICGETGVGKELVARALHDESGRQGEFVAVNCSALADGVLQSELFGHARGAFSGARETRPGLVASAAGGTLFLDEIGDASPTLQASLLRLLEQREYRAVGSDVARRTDTRFVTATHVDLRAAVAAGRFRADLLNRLERWNIDVPALRQRRQDVLPLAQHFARRLTGRERPLSRSLAFALLRYDWPGNVRQLQSIVEQAVVASPNDLELTLDAELAAKLRPTSPYAYATQQALQQTLEDLPPPLPSGTRRQHRMPVERPAPSELRARFQELECNARRLADELNIGRTTLYRWFSDAGIDIRELRGARG